jgi:hypothetical protein
MQIASSLLRDSLLDEGSHLEEQARQLPAQMLLDDDDGDLIVSD